MTATLREDSERSKKRPVNLNQLHMVDILSHAARKLVLSEQTSIHT